MKLRSKVGAAFVALFAAFAVTMVVAPPASAHYSQCPDGYFCMWEHSSYEGAFFKTNRSVSNVGSSFNDKATSFWNRTDVWVTVFQHAGYTGDALGGGFGVPSGIKCVNFAPGASTAAVIGDFNDDATSALGNSYNPSCYHTYR